MEMLQAKKFRVIRSTLLSIALLWICSSANVSIAQLPKASEYHPLSVGNEWIYNVLQDNPFWEIYIESDTLLGDTLRIYEAHENFAGYGRQKLYYYYNEDSTVIYQAEEFPPNLNSGFPILDTSKGIGVKWVVTYDNITRAFAIVDTGIAIMFGRIWKDADIYEVDPVADSLVLLESLSRYVLGIGPIQFGETSLIYARINGVEYGEHPSAIDEISDDNMSNIPKGFHLHVYPNPVKESATFFFNNSLQQEFELFIVNILGRTVRQFETKLTSNTSKLFWDGKDNNGNSLPNGAYFAIVKSGHILSSTKFIYLKR